MHLRLNATGCVVAVALLTTPALAYLPTTAELRELWDRPRAATPAVYLRYAGAPPVIDVLEIYVRYDGCWAKRVKAGDTTGPWTWRCGRTRWEESNGRWTSIGRGPAGWDDWAFEPDLDTLLALTPPERLARRGLGRWRDGHLWLYGARHEGEGGTWLGLERKPLRLRLWRSENDNIGRVELDYRDVDQRFP